MIPIPIYTEVDCSVWATLFSRQKAAVQRHAYAAFFPSLDQLQLSADRIPTIANLNQQLKPLTGWSLYEVPGLIPNEFFFAQMSQRMFGTTTWLRKPEQLDYLEEPDMFHDVFGHIPQLADLRITSFLSSLAQLAIDNDCEEHVVEAIARLYWYTVEFGLVREGEAIKIYGAGILSSIAETERCAGNDITLRPFDVTTIVQTPYIKDSFQEQYFVLENMDQLATAIPEMQQLMQNKALMQTVIA